MGLIIGTGNSNGGGVSGKKAVPSGGLEGQVLTKKSDANYDTEWTDPVETEPVGAVTPLADPYEYATKDELNQLGQKLEGTYIEKPEGVYGVSIGSLSPGEAINITITDTTASYVSLMSGGSVLASFIKDVPSSYINNTGAEQSLILQTNPNDVIKAFIQTPLQDNANNSYCIPRSVTLPASGNTYTSRAFYLKRGVKYSLDIQDWVIPTGASGTTFQVVLDGVAIITQVVEKICFTANWSNSSDFAVLTVGGKIATGHNATLTLSNENIEEQEVEIAGQGSQYVKHIFGVNDGKKYYVDARKWVSNDSASGGHFAIVLLKRDGTSVILVNETTQVNDYSGLYEIDTTGVVAIQVGGRIKADVTAIVKVYEKKDTPVLETNIVGQGTTYITGKIDVWPGVYKASVSNWDSVSVGGGAAFAIFLKDINGNTLFLKNTFSAARNFDGDYLVTVPKNYCEIYFSGRVKQGNVAHIEATRLQSAEDFPANGFSLDFPVLGCSRRSILKPNCTYAHGGTVIFNEKYIYIIHSCSDSFYGENFYSTIELVVINKYNKTIRYVDVFSPRAIYLNGQLLDYLHNVGLVSLSDSSVRAFGGTNISGEFTIINKTYDADQNTLGENSPCNLKYNENTVTYNISNFITMVNSLYSLGLVAYPNKSSYDLPKLCKYNGAYYGAFSVDECTSDTVAEWTANTFVIMKSTDGITWEPVNCVTGDYQVTETGIAFCDNKFFIIGRNETGHFCWYCVTDINGNVLKPMTQIPNSINSMPTITTSRNKVYAMYNVYPDSGSYYTRTKCCFAEIGTDGSYDLTVLKTYTDNNGIHYCNMATKPNGVILMSYITDPESFLTNDNPTADICLAEIQA